MKKLVPVLIMLILLTSMRFNTSLARLLDDHNRAAELVELNAEIPDLKVNVYPNPVINNRINIAANQNMQSIKILTIVGSVVINEEYEAGITHVQLDLNQLNKGLYLLKIQFDEERTYTEKILVK